MHVYLNTLATALYVKIANELKALLQLNRRRQGKRTQLVPQQDSGGKAVVVQRPGFFSP